MHDEAKIACKYQSNTPSTPVKKSPAYNENIGIGTKLLICNSSHQQHPPPPKKKKTRVREKITYKLNGQKYKYDISSHKESKFQGSPFPISSNMNSQMVRGLAGCAMSKSKPFLQKSKCDADKLKMTHWQQFLRNISIHANNLY